MYQRILVSQNIVFYTKNLLHLLCKYLFLLDIDGLVFQNEDKNHQRFRNLLCIDIKEC